LYIIDQHAAHERLLYDDMVFDINHSSLVMQDLLVPYTRSFSVEDYEIISQVLDDLQILGFDIYEYGKRSIKITTIPFNLRGINIDDFIDSFLNDKTFKESLKASDLVNDNLIQAACKAAIKGGDKLNEKQINNLVLKMLDNNTPLRCPHGRPAVICITETEMEKWFKRIV